MIRIKLYFGNYEVAKLLVKAKAILEAMENNAFFLIAAAAVTELKNRFEKLERLVLEIENGNKNLTADKDEWQKKVVEQLEIVGLFVCAISEGDLDKIKTSGYELKKERSRSTQPKPMVELTNVILSKGDEPTDVLVEIKQRTPKVKAFNYAYTDQDPSLVENPAWVKKGSDLKKFTFRNVPFKRDLWFKVEGIGEKGQTTTSKIIMYIAY